MTTPTDALPVVAWSGDGTFISDAVKQTSRQWFSSQYPTPLCTVESARAALAAQAEAHAELGKQLEMAEYWQRLAQAERDALRAERDALQTGAQAALEALTCAESHKQPFIHSAVAQTLLRDALARTGGTA
jgi:hypothetical protein